LTSTFITFGSYSFSFTATLSLLMTTAVKKKLIMTNHGVTQFSRENFYILSQKIMLTGRINRLNYFLGIILANLGGWLGSSLIGPDEGLGVLISLLGMFIVFCAVYLGVSLNIRRFHDMSMSGSYFIALFIPLVNIVLVVMLLFNFGTKGSNQYGPPDDQNFWSSLLAMKYKPDTNTKESGEAGDTKDDEISSEVKTQKKNNNGTEEEPQNEVNENSDSSQSNYCSNCGEKIEGEPNYCMSCGEKI